jgi:hydroxypyruvate isomerase
MPQFAANLSMMYVEHPFLDRFEAAAKDGFKAVEFLFPYEWTAKELAARLHQNDLQQVLFNAPPGGVDKESITQAWSDGFKGVASLPGKENEFKKGFELALEYAQTLDCHRIHVMAGIYAAPVNVYKKLPKDLQTSSDSINTQVLQRKTYINNLQWACAQAAKVGKNILIEPINTRDIPDFFLNRQDQAHAIIEEVGASNLQVQMDLYHCQIVEGDVDTKIKNYLPTGRVGHFQIAGVPLRNEPDMGELNYSHLLDVIDAVSQSCNWQGWVGCEYRPVHGAQANGTSSGLGWFKNRKGNNERCASIE